jgi:integrase-like protein
MAKENRDWGYDRIAGALANLGYEVCDQTVGNVLQRHGLPAAPERKRTTTWSAFIRPHLALLAGTDFFTAEVLTLRGLVTYYVLFFTHLESRWVDIAGITVDPDESWMKQIARNVTMEGYGALRDCRYLLHDRDAKYTQSFRAIIASGRVEPLVLPARSPNLNAYAERWVRSVKEECLCKVILFGERSLRRALSEYVEHFQAERNHQGKGNVLLLLGVQTPAATGMFNAASDWAACYVFTIRRQRNGVPANERTDRNKCGNPMRIKDARQGLPTLLQTQDLDGLMLLYKRLEKPGRALLLCLLCAETSWQILLIVWLRLERAYFKLRLFCRCNSQ